MSPEPPPFMMMGTQCCATALKITLSRGRRKCKKGRMMRTCLSWIQPHPHGAILRDLLNTVNSFLCSSTNYFENQLLPNDLIIVRNHEDDGRTNRISRGHWRGKEMRTTRWISNPIQNSRVLLRVQLRIQDHLCFKLMYRTNTNTKSDLDVLHMHRNRTR
jgi:hypothetical protein